MYVLATLKRAKKTSPTEVRAAAKKRVAPCWQKNNRSIWTSHCACQADEGRVIKMESISASLIAEELPVWTMSPEVCSEALWWKERRFGSHFSQACSFPWGFYLQGLCHDESYRWPPSGPTPERLGSKTEHTLCENTEVLTPKETILDCHQGRADSMHSINQDIQKLSSSTGSSLSIKQLLGSYIFPSKFNAFALQEIYIEIYSNSYRLLIKLLFWQPCWNDTLEYCFPL